MKKIIILLVYLIFIFPFWACETVKTENGKQTIIEAVDSIYIPVEGLKLILLKNEVIMGEYRTDKNGKHTFADLLEGIKTDTVTINDTTHIYHSAAIDWTLEIIDTDGNANRDYFATNFININDTVEYYRVVMKKLATTTK